jgi:hypothetical protein
MGKLVNAVAIAELLDVKPDTVLAMARRGELPRVVVNKQVVRFDPEEVRAALGRRPQRPPPQLVEVTGPGHLP